MLTFLFTNPFHSKSAGMRWTCVKSDNVQWHTEVMVFTYCASHVSVQRSCGVCLLGHNLVELLPAMLHRGNDVSFELSKAVLDGEHVVSVVVLFDHL